MTFAENLRKYRLQNGLTQIDLASKCGINPKTLSSYETGRTEPNLGEIRKLCEVFHCSIAALIGTKERESSTISIDDIVLKLQDFDDDTLKRLIITIETILDNRIEIKEIMEEKRLLEKRLEEYNKKMQKLMKER
jgi:transcriptional regulator with XRE-family HTH domain